MKRILFINPFNVGMSDYMKTKHNKEDVAIRYGILSIASYIKQNLKEYIEIKIIDYTTKEFEEYTYEKYFQHLKNFILEYKPDFIGLSAMFNFLLEIIMEIANSCKSIDEKILVFAGGPCAMAYAEKMLKNSNIDSICFFEGEIPILELCKSKDAFFEIEKGMSWLTLDKLNKGYQPQPLMIEDLDEIPTLKFNLLEDLEQYMNVNNIYNLKGIAYKSLPIHTSRGCPFNCIFCASHFVHGKKMRMMSAERVISDVRHMVEKYGITHLEICDDQFLINIERAKKILSGLAEFNLEVSVPSGVSAFIIDEEIARLMKSAGMNTISLAIESGCEYIIKNIIDKPINLNKISQILEHLKNNDMKVHAFVVLGFPGELDSHRKESVEFLKKSSFDWFSVVCATPLKGSRLYDICLENKYIEEKYESKDGFYKSAITTEDFTAEEISEVVYYTNLELNFVNNYNLRVGNYEEAFEYFNYVATKFPFHAFAHYYIAKALEGMGKVTELVNKEYEKFFEIVKNDKEWKKYAEHFNLIEKGLF